MEYTIRELADLSGVTTRTLRWDLSGVTTRTLRWYDQIGLLKPGRVAENGYRYYGAAQVDRLQDILYYRALGVELAQIKACLDDPSFDRLAALRGHLTALEQEQARLEALIRSVRKTISAQERKELMNDQEKFEALKQRAVAWHEETYGREAREKYGDREVDAAQNTVRGLTQEQYREWTGLGDEILRRLEDAVRSQTPPDSLEGREITQLHRRWLTLSGNTYDPTKHMGLAAKHMGLAQLYIQDERFTAYYDRTVPGCARFLCEAVCRWADQI